MPDPACHRLAAQTKGRWVNHEARSADGADRATDEGIPPRKDGTGCSSSNRARRDGRRRAGSGRRHGRRNERGGGSHPAARRAGRGDGADRGTPHRPARRGRRPGRASAGACGPRPGGGAKAAYQILVASSPDRLTAARADVWNSGRVGSSDSVAVRYAGKPLRASTRYHWTVTVWDAEGRPAGTAAPAFFETGLHEHRRRHRLGRRAVDRDEGEDPQLRRRAACCAQRRQTAGLRSTGPGPRGPAVRLRPRRVRRLRQRPPGDRSAGRRHHDRTAAPGLDELRRARQLHDLRRHGPRAAGAGRHPRGRPGQRLVQRPDIRRQHLLLGGRQRPGGQGQAADPVRRRRRRRPSSPTPGGGWKATDTGPYRADDIYDGQTYDARRELPGWTSHGFDDSAWSDVERVDFDDRYPDVPAGRLPGRDRPPDARMGPPTAVDHRRHRGDRTGRQPQRQGPHRRGPRPDGDRPRRGGLRPGHDRPRRHRRLRPRPEHGRRGPLQPARPGRSQGRVQVRRDAQRRQRGRGRPRGLRLPGQPPHRQGHQHVHPQGRPDRARPTRTP